MTIQRLSTGRNVETVEISDETLERMILKGEVPELNNSHVIHKQRYVKTVTEASAAVCGVESRDGYIRARLASRRKMPSFNSKCQYQAQAEQSESDDE